MNDNLYHNVVGESTYHEILQGPIRQWRRHTEMSMFIAINYQIYIKDCRRLVSNTQAILNVTTK